MEKFGGLEAEFELLGEFQRVPTGLVRRFCSRLHEKMEGGRGGMKGYRGLESNRGCVSSRCFHPDRFLTRSRERRCMCARSGASVDSFSKPLVRRTDKVESIDSSSFHLRIHSNPRGIDQRLRLDTSAHELKREKPLTNRVPSLWMDYNTMER